MYGKNHTLRTALTVKGSRLAKLPAAFKRVRSVKELFNLSLVTAVDSEVQIGLDLEVPAETRCAVNNWLPPDRLGDVVNAVIEANESVLKGFRVREVTDGLIKLTAIRGLACPVCARVHENENAFVTFKVTAKEIVSQLVCFRKRESPLQLKKTQGNFRHWML